MRLYDFRLQKTPEQCKYHHTLYNNTTHRAFDIIYIMKALFLDANEWDGYVVFELTRLYVEYIAIIVITCLGFPSDLKALLLKDRPQEEVAATKE